VPYNSPTLIVSENTTSSDSLDASLQDALHPIYAAATNNNEPATLPQMIPLIMVERNLMVMVRFPSGSH
jgi:hypothetical protein